MSPRTATTNTALYCLIGLNYMMFSTFAQVPTPPPPLSNGNATGDPSSSIGPTLSPNQTTTTEEPSDGVSIGSSSADWYVIAGSIVVVFFLVGASCYVLLMWQQKALRDYRGKFENILKEEGMQRQLISEDFSARDDLILERLEAKLRMGKHASVQEEVEILARQEFKALTEAKAKKPATLKTNTAAAATAGAAAVGASGKEGTAQKDRDIFAVPVPQNEPATGSRLLGDRDVKGNAAATRGPFYVPPSLSHRGERFHQTEDALEMEFGDGRTGRRGGYAPHLRAQQHAQDPFRASIEESVQVHENLEKLKSFSQLRNVVNLS